MPPNPLLRRRIAYSNGFVDVVSPSQYVEKLVTFTGAAGLGDQGAVPIFDVAGVVIIDRIVPVCEADLVGASATLALGVTGATTLLIGATTATDIDDGDYWISTAPASLGLAIPAALKEVAIAADVIGTVATADVTAGAIRFCCWYTPVSSDGALVAAA